MKPIHGGRRKGAGRPFAYDEPTQWVTVRVPKRIGQKLRRRAHDDNRPLTRVILEIIEDYFEDEATRNL